MLNMLIRLHISNIRPTFAPTKQTTSSIMATTTDKKVKQIVSAIKKALKEQTCNVPQVRIKFEKTSLNGHTCDVEIGDNFWEELSRTQMATLKDEIKNIKGLVVVESDNIFLGRTYWDASPDITNFPTLVCVFSKPCKEFNQLAKLVAKKYGINLQITDLYSVRLFGKSGRYDEYGNRNYNAAYNSALCQRYIDYIKSFGRKRTTCKLVSDDEIEDLEYSIRALTECYGYRTRRLRIERA